MTPPLVRPAHRSDVRAVIGLWRQMMDLHRRLDARFTIAPNAAEAYEGYLRRCIRSGSSEVLVATAADGVVGYAVVTELENPQMFALGRFGFIAEMCVDEGERRKAIGRRLWEAVVQWCRERGLTVIQLNVSVLNEGGRAFWRKMGCRDYLEVLWYDMEQGKQDSRHPDHTGDPGGEFE